VIYRPVLFLQASLKGSDPWRQEAIKLAERPKEPRDGGRWKSGC
jgi:hypothetical protein